MAVWPKRPRRRIDAAIASIVMSKMTGNEPKTVLLKPLPGDAGQRLDAYLAAHLEDVSRSRAAALAEDGLVLADGRRVRKNHRLSGEGEITVSIPPPLPSEVPGADIPLDVIYEDGDILVVNKPKGMVVHPAPGHSGDTMVNALISRLGDGLSGIGGTLRPGIVHRLDKDTSGLLLVAKNDLAHASLSSQLKARTIDRVYEAVVVGRVRTEGEDGIFTIDAPLGRSDRDRKKIAVRRDGRRAVTHVRVIGEYAGFTHVECRLETGRTHQIRVHMAHIGRPVLGDTVYGGKKQPAGLEGQCLHARSIAFGHPRNGERMTFTSPLPEYFTRVLTNLSKLR